ncbi:glutathione S-transferase family protein [Mangrovicoccus algicola]|uniref:Glutathione S-transferase family protein n=1 Tax=Mangrovicoccus algicola TaxID=2771008 RepID=A0A8J7CWL2_9RHOB|nr:glutathione S-transferase family protein [Mangrovicoccus algicola]MBE3637902.1 glutathione S-transferase family protein [Mangrovicoccus algicola]
MGLLVDGVWKDQWYDTDKTGGKFERSKSQFRNWITADGSAGPSGTDGFRAEPGRYHLYVAYACPWAHRALIFRALKGLEEMISVSFVNWYMGDHGWSFEDPGDGIPGDDLFGLDYLYQIYLKADPGYTGRVTVPTLWDKARGTVVSNESAEIIRMFNSAFDGVGATPGDYYPEDLREEIDALNDRIYHTVNNGVYKCGFATTQSAYDEAVGPLFETLDWLEDRLSARRYLAGDRVTEADWRLFTTLLRFDPVYHGHFKCDRRRIADYPNLWGYTRELYQWPGIAGTVNMDHTRRHYYISHETVNPHRILSVGPEIDLDAPHGRGG